MATEWTDEKHRLYLDSMEASFVKQLYNNEYGPGSMATEWTDEKHRLYLDCMEASFVKKLYNNEYGPNGTLGWLLRAQIQTNSSASESPDVQSLPFGQLKVLRRGCWKNLKSERVNSQYANENESRKKSTNPWVRHFRSPSTAKAPHPTSPAQMGENDLVNQSVDLINWRHGREATSSEKPSPFCSRKVHNVSIGCITEVSDQNFLDLDIERGEELSGRRSAKRARSAASPITDQAVLFVPPTSEKTAFLKENNEEDSKGDVESTAESQSSVPRTPYPYPYHESKRTANMVTLRKSGNADADSSTGFTLH